MLSYSIIRLPNRTRCVSGFWAVNAKFTAAGKIKARVKFFISSGNYIISFFNYNMSFENYQSLFSVK